MFIERSIFGIAAMAAALSFVGTVSAQDVPSPYGAAPAGGAAAAEAGAGAAAPAAEPADSYGATGSATASPASVGAAASADPGTAAAADAPPAEKKGPSPTWLAEQNRASAKLREEQVAKMQGAAGADPASPPAAQ